MLLFFSSKGSILTKLYFFAPFSGGVNACRDGLWKLVKVIFSPEGKKTCQDSSKILQQDQYRVYHAEAEDTILPFTNGLWQKKCCRFLQKSLANCCLLSLYRSEGSKGNLSKTFQRILPVKGGGVPPFPLSFFEHNDCPLRGGVPPNSVKEKIG